MDTLKVLIVFVLFFLSFPFAADNAEKRLVVGNFSDASPSFLLPPGWELQFFKNIDRHTRYDLVKEDGDVVVRAESHGAASSLIRKIKISPLEYPVLIWKWKITTILNKGNARKKEGDDFPARLYVTFQYDSSRLGLLERVKYEAARLLYGEYPPLGAIIYIWANKIPKGTVLPSPYSDRAVLIAVESGTDRVNHWMMETRNVLSDYRSYFKQDPTEISAVAIMTDSDNTGESAIAFYGDIVFENIRKYPK